MPLIKTIYRKLSRWHAMARLSCCCRCGALSVGLWPALVAPPAASPSACSTGTRSNCWHNEMERGIRERGLQGERERRPVKYGREGINERVISLEQKNTKWLGNERGALVSRLICPAGLFERERRKKKSKRTDEDRKKNRNEQRNEGDGRILPCHHSAWLVELQSHQDS